MVMTISMTIFLHKARPIGWKSKQTLFTDWLHNAAQRACVTAWRDHHIYPNFDIKGVNEQIDHDFTEMWSKPPDGITPAQP